MADKCSEVVDRGYGRYTMLQECGRDAVEDGLCKIHLRVRARRIEKALAYDKKMRRNEQIKNEAERIGALLGIKVDAEYSTFVDGGGYTGRMTVPAEWLAEIAEHGLLPRVTDADD